MSADEGSAGTRPHRPLPSVGIPLLREERRAHRTQQAIVALGALAGVSAVAAISLLATRWPHASATTPAEAPSASATSAPAAPDGPPPSSNATPPPPVPVARREPPRPDPVAPPDAATATATAAPASRDGLTATTRLFGNAHSFRDALRASGVGADDAQKIIDSLDRVFDFRRCRPEHTLIVERRADGRLARFEYRAGLTQRVEAVATARGSFEARRVDVPIQTRRVAAGGTVRASLGDAFEALGLGRSLVGAFVEVFEGRVNFSTATREGDTFRIVVDEERVDGTFLRHGTVHAVEYVGGRAGRLRAYYFEESDQRGEHFDATGRSMHGGWLRTPLRYDHISSPFDPRRMHPILRRTVPHEGIDYAAASGTPVWAAADGVVTFAGERGANGNLVSIRHANGFESFYAHLLRIQRGIRAGATVRQRDMIGTVGSTGRSTGPHLHFGLKRRGRFVDPMSELNGPGRMLTPGALSAFRRAQSRLDRELDAIAIAAASDRAAPAPAPAGTD